MKHFLIPAILIFLGALLSLTTGCGQAEVRMGPEATKAVLDSTNNNDAIADSLAPEKPVHAAGIKDNNEVIRAAVGENGQRNDRMKELLEKWEASKEAEISALRASWERDSAAAYQQQKAENEAKIAKIKEEAQMSWLAKALTGGGIVAVTLGLARGALALAPLFGIPIPGWIGNAVSVASGAGGYVNKVKALKGLATGSEAGIEALRQLEEELAPDEIKALLQEKTNGRISSLTELFKTFARAQQVDQGIHDQVKTELEEVRNEMPTDQGKAIVSLGKFLEQIK